MKRNDMTWSQFQKACKRRGIGASKDSYLGLCKMRMVEGEGQSYVSRYNGGNTLREQLVYLIKAQTKIDNRNKGTNDAR